MTDYIKKTEKQVREYYSKAPLDNKKAFMIWVADNVPKEYQGYCRSLYFGNKINVIKSGNKKAPHYKRLKDMGIDNYSSVFTQEEDDE